MKQLRKTRSDAGVISLLSDTLSIGFGLTPELADDVLKLIKRKSEYAAMKTHIKEMDGVVHKRLNQALDRAQEKSESASDDDADPEENPTEVEASGQAEQPVKESFVKFLINEISARDVAKSQLQNMGQDKTERVTVARQADSTLQKDLATRQQDLEKSQDPLDRQIAQLTRRLAQLQLQKKTKQETM